VEAAPVVSMQPIASNPAVAVFEQHGASVVNITSLAVVPVGGTVPSGSSVQPRGAGSGFVYDARGHIVTNNHVVEQADQLRVTFSDRAFVTATLVGRDPDNDLAVIHVEPSATNSSGKPVENYLKPVTMGDSNTIQTGETAMAIGSPLGLQQTVTAGIVSALRAPGEDASGGQPVDLLGGAVQTDASINPGNSGGPLFNARGEVIGVNTAILSQSGGNEGIGFAIPANVVKRVVPELIQNGRYRHPQVGITGVALSVISPQTRQQLGLPTDQEGVLVVRVSDGAQAAGIQGATRPAAAGSTQIPAGGDIVVAIDGRPVATTGEMRGYIENNKRPGDVVTLSILRNGQPMEVQVTLGERPEQP
jgi:2-alkenal reductase